MADDTLTGTFEAVAQIDWQVGDLDLHTEDINSASWLNTHRGQVSSAMWAWFLPVNKMGFSHWKVQVVAGELSRVTYLDGQSS